MHNNTGIKKETYGNVQQILFAVEHQVSVGIVVDETCGVEQTNGRKIAKAGTPVTGDLDKRTVAFTPATTGVSTDVIGVLLHDVDVTTGDNNGTLLLFGFVNTNRLDETTKGKITADIKKALPKITFMAC
jgi:hypothetical protein|nr:MAG TPA: Head decoration protein [Caudoviricetes sp.]